MKRLLFRKSFTENFMDMMQKAQNSHGNLIPVKKMGKDGVNRTYWISPEDMNQGKMKGQQNLFGDDEMDQTEDGTGFSKRGFPIVLVSGEERKMFVDEIVNINELIEKYGKTA